jgi:hypothetical protein
MFWREGDKGTKTIQEREKEARNEDTKETISCSISTGILY